MSNQGIYQELRLTVVASGVVSSQKCVTFAGAQAAVAGEKVLGVAWCDAASGDSLAVDVCGVAHVIAGGVIALGDSLTVDSSGRAVAASVLAASALAVAAGATPVTSSAANGAIVSGNALSGGILPQFVFADAMEAASGAGKIIAVLFRR